VTRPLFEDVGDVPDDALLPGIQCVIRHMVGNKKWAARATGCKDYAYGRTAAEAIANAKAMTKPKALTRTKLL
jgi:hypothetical protein